MSNYLDSIVARSLGVAEVVQPRLPQLFEQANDYLTEPAELYVENVIEQVVSKGTDETAAMTLAHPTTHTVAPHVEHAKTSVSSTIVVKEISQRTVTSSTPAFEAAEKGSVITDGQNAFTSIKTQETPSPTPMVAAEVNDQRRPQNHVGRSFTPPSHKTVLVPAARQVRHGPAAATLNAAIPPISFSLPAASVAQPPTAIKVTIGRVDVRAVLPATTPSRPAPTRPKPALSLENYLKEREQGKR